MATYKKKYVDTARQYSGPSGNASRMSFKMETTAAGVVVDSDATAALQIGDKVKLGVLPAGMTLMDSLGIVSNAFTALSTGALGFEYVDGVDSTDVPQDADYFNAALALNALGRTRANNNAVTPVTLPKDAYLILTNAGAAMAEAGRLDFIVEGILTGRP